MPHVSFDATPSIADFPSLISPYSLVVAPLESDPNPLVELRLPKSQLGDVARVRIAVSRGDLTHKIRVRRSIIWRNRCWVICVLVRMTVRGP
ncbi:hypothetical protein PLICRDRAFT_349043 [Plicaturopsis crispa FD-325 SS-3]|uniref:Unplaced genomic scaffold PLICRscaffold_16, whole genome shotgun sequence n=1 Tax=Plicaturopsis crispa FD-325 SS-3 TaxID=944288 RepID=A0A0C9SRR4_PLICR|nr:hypothetical protein PLICRDRAFT_349043 [Plicaturopsis crispa FD-325 SS-3]